MSQSPDIEQILSSLDRELTRLLDGRLCDVGEYDGELVEASRDRRICFRVRIPAELEGPLAVVLISPGGLGGEVGHTEYGHFGSVLARMGFIAINLNHQPSKNEVQHRYNTPLDVSYVIDALTHTKMMTLHLPHDPEMAIKLPDNFPGVPDIDRIGVLGHSFGAFTAHAVGGVEHAPAMGIRNFRDPRVSAVVPIAPQGENRYGCFDRGESDNSWKNVVIPSLVVVGDQDLPDWRRQPFDRYPANGNKFLITGKNQSHSGIAGYGDLNSASFVALNAGLFFHVYLRNGDLADQIGKISMPAGWTLERK